MRVRLFILCCLLPLRSMAAEPPPETMPSMAFLEYLGGVEEEIDGRLSSPVELDLESVVAATTTEPEKRRTSPDAHSAGTEEKIDE